MSCTLSLATEAFDPKLYNPVKLTGTETVNELFSYSFVVKTPDRDNLSMALQDMCASADLAQSEFVVLVYYQLARAGYDTVKVFFEEGLLEYTRRLEAYVLATGKALNAIYNTTVVYI